MSNENEANDVHDEDYLLLTQVSSPRSSDDDEENKPQKVNTVPGTADVNVVAPQNSGSQTMESRMVIEKDLSSVGLWEINDDDDSGSQSSVSLSQDPILEMPMSLTERRAFNIQRNNALLSRLGMLKNNYSSPFKSVDPRKDELVDNLGNSPAPMTEACRGMTFPTCWTNVERQQLHCSHKTLPSSLKELNDRYPHRSSQIRKLFSLLSASVMGAPLAPPAIFVVGPAGTGKTMIVRDVVHSFCCMHYDSSSSTAVPTASDGPELSPKLTKQNRRVLNAYIDCATLDSFKMEEFFSSAFSQWRAQITSAAAMDDACNRCPRKIQPRLDKETTSNGNAQSKACIPSVNNYEVQRKGQAKARSRKASSKVDKNLLNLNSSIDPASREQIHGPQNVTLAAVWTFGRSIKYMMDKMKREVSFLVSFVLIVDHAELLLSLGTSHTKTLAGDRINLFAQLLMLPQAFGFNLNIIAITKSGLLEHTALNNMKSQGTIGIHLCPVSIHFPAYRGKAVIQSILLQDNMKRLIVGQDADDDSSAFRDIVFRSFLETLVQSLNDITCDLKEYVRLGRSLWPKYIIPIIPKNIAGTVMHVKQTNQDIASSGNGNLFQREILSFLDQAFFPNLRHGLDHGLGILTFASSVVNDPMNSYCTCDYNTPVLVKYLLIAAYICQVNRPEKDRHMFSIEKNGKRRRKTKEDDTGEEVAFGSQDPLLKTMRPRTFPVERLYSLYVSIVSLHASTCYMSSSARDETEMLKSLGNVPFLETVTYLRDIGVFHDFPKRSPIEPIRFLQRHFWTSITREDAMEIATSIDFPLDRYIL